MLKILFCALLTANFLLFAYHHGYLGTASPEQHDPERASKQFNLERMKVLPAETFAPGASATVLPSAPTSPLVSAVPSAAIPATLAKTDVVACTEIGNFSEKEAKRFKTLVAPLSLGDKLTQQALEEVISHIVYIPPQGSKEGADKKAAELRRLGINDFYILQDTTDMRWSISLGVFKTQESAQTLLNELIKKGVRSARQGKRTLAIKKSTFQVRDMDAKIKERLQPILDTFPKLESRACI